MSFGQSVSHHSWHWWVLAKVWSYKPSIRWFLNEFWWVLGEILSYNPWIWWMLGEVWSQNPWLWWDINNDWSQTLKFDGFWVKFNPITPQSDGFKIGFDLRILDFDGSLTRLDHTSFSMMGSGLGFT